VPQAQLANPQASMNPLDYFNPFGGTTQGGAGTGVPTQRAVGFGVGTVSNLLFPGLGFLTGPLARMVTKMIQGGASPQQVKSALASHPAAAAQAQSPVSLAPPPPPPQTGGGFSPTGQPAVGREWWSGDFGRGMLDQFGMGPGNYNLAGPGGMFGQRGTGFGSGTVGNFATAIGFGGNLGGGGPVNVGRYMGQAGLNRPFTQQQYENIPRQMKYAAPTLSGAAGGVTQRPSYEQYLSAWNPPAAPAPFEDPRQRQGNQSRHMGQRQNQQKGTADVGNPGMTIFRKHQRLQRGTENLEQGPLPPEKKLWGQKELAGLYDPGPGAPPEQEHDDLTMTDAERFKPTAAQRESVYGTIDVDINGQEFEIPLLYEGMTPEEAEEAARMRLEVGLSPFASDDELEAEQNEYARGTSNINPALNLFRKRLRKKPKP
jgi:hypothetical protein